MFKPYTEKAWHADTSGRVTPIVRFKALPMATSRVTLVKALRLHYGCGLAEAVAIGAEGLLVNYPSSMLEEVATLLPIATFHGYTLEIGLWEEPLPARQPINLGKLGPKPVSAEEETTLGDILRGAEASLEARRRQG